MTRSSHSAVRSSHLSSSFFAFAIDSGTLIAAVASSFAANPGHRAQPQQSYRVAYRRHGFFGCCNGFLRSVLNGLPYLCRILRQRMPPFPNGSQMRICALHRQRFAFHTGDRGLRAALGNVGQPFRSLKIWCRLPTGQRSGLPRSVSLGRSVTLFLIFCSTAAASSLSRIELPYDFDIFRLSVPSSLGEGVSNVCGSGKTGLSFSL